MGAVLFPREHGAYAQLAFPILSGLLLGRPGLASFAFAAAAALVFLTSEPIEILVGARGRHPQERMGPAARRQLALLAPMIAAAGLAALAAASDHARTIALVPLGVGAALIPVVFLRRLKTLPAELLAALGFASLHLPIGAASGLAGPALTDPAAVWFLAFAITTLSVHTIKARHMQRDLWLAPAALLATTAATLTAALIALHHPAHRAAALAFSIPAAAILVFNLLRVPPRALKAVGWAVTAANAAALTVLLLD